MYQIFFEMLDLVALWGGRLILGLLAVVFGGLLIVVSGELILTMIVMIGIGIRAVVVPYHEEPYTSEP